MKAGHAEKILSDIVHRSLETHNGPRAAARICAAVLSADGGAVKVCAKKDFRSSAVGDDSRFYIYSVTKSIIAALILKLAGRGSFSTGDMLDRWFAGVRNLDRVSVYDCLRHTGGLPDYGGDPAYNEAVKAGGEPWPFDEFMRRVMGDELLFTPGRQFSYSNIGYMLLKKIVEIEYGMTFSQAVACDVAAPLSLSHTAVSETKGSLEENIFGPSAYLGSKESPADVYKIYHPGWVSHGVISSTAYETAVMMEAILSGRLLPQGQVELMTRGVKVEGVTGRPFYEPRYGAGLMIDTGAPYGPVCGHTGGGPGASAACYRMSGKKYSPPVTLAVLTDGEDSVQAERIVYDFFENFNG